MKVTQLLQVAILTWPALARAQTPTPTPTPSPAPAATPVAAPTAPPVWTAKPAGMLAIVASRNEGGVNVIDLPLFATGADLNTFTATARGTRVGVAISNVSGPGLFGTAKVNGVVEADFFGGLPGQGLGDFSPVMRMRHAYAKADFPIGNLGMSLLAGQSWSVFAPMHPKSVGRTFFPEFQGSGNLYMRQPMLSAALTAGPVSVTIAGVAPGDPAAAGGTAFSQANIPGPGELSASPALEARVAFSQKLIDGKLPIDFGVSGRYGTERISATGAHIPSSAAALDGKIGFGPVWVQGEAFMGENLDMYTGLDGTQILVTGTGAGAVAALSDTSIATAGGWVQAGITYKNFELSAGYGEQGLDPKDMGNGNLIRQNQTWTGAFTWRPAPTLAVGLEYNYIETTRRANGAAPYVNAIARHADIAMTLSF